MVDVKFLVKVISKDFKYDFLVKILSVAPIKKLRPDIFRKIFSEDFQKDFKIKTKNQTKNRLTIKKDGRRRLLKI